MKTKCNGMRRYGYLVMEYAEINLAEFIKLKEEEKSRATRKEIGCVVSTLL